MSDERKAVEADPSDRAAGTRGRISYRPPRLVAHGTLADLTRSGEGTALDGGAGFAFSGAEP